MGRVKSGLTTKLAHRWHGPFRVKKQVEKCAYEPELPGEIGYRFYPVVHISRLKAVTGSSERPKTRLTAELDESQRIDFDEELLPDNSWEPDTNVNHYEGEVILDNKLPSSTRHLVDYRQQKKRENRLQMVQVADEN
ncbi:hypothetical protein PC110_g19879 [Phytophthora cactorum]|uniref:Tf2-1-like SH3-like domain-containing protein n=1 Tax=Phytophthora cactorum TaxID=29920 RepID=A0A329RGF9_9STRA|nr:hypothetical protein PC110_g19879 [Phytophthora cactorum]